MHENISFVIELLGLVSFSMSGAFAAMEKKLDPFGNIFRWRDIKRCVA